MASERILDKLIVLLGYEYDTTALDKAQRGLNNFAGNVGALGGIMAGMGAAVTAAFALAGKAAIGWEDDFTGVRKTVNATEEEFAALEKQLRDMAKEDIPVDVGELAGLAEQAGQLGIQTPKIRDFVAVIAKLSLQPLT